MKTLRTILVFIILTSLLMSDVTAAQAIRSMSSGFHGRLNESNVPNNTSMTAGVNNARDSQLGLATGFTCITLDSKPAVTTATTGEKPQSKVWTYAGSWYAVFPTSAAGASSAGTWVWRLAGTTWTEVLLLSTRTDAHADVLVDGSLTHILLWSDSITQLASIEYADGTYLFWSDRNTLVSIPSPVNETATIALDSTGVMWLASRMARNIVVYHSVSPFSTWAGPIELETDVLGDDIEVITALPNGTVGVFWSNQNVERFGFRYHVDGEPATTWSVNEVPASQSALNVGSGMADNHMNVAVASDGTLYVAVKTSYDTGGYPKMALLVRRPDGTWDDLYDVDTSGTRPLVLLDDNNDSLTLIYTAIESGGSIVYQQTSTQGIAFEGPPPKLLRSGSFNDVSSMKSNIEDGFVVIYSNGTEVAGQYCSIDTGVYADLAISMTGGVSEILPGDTLTNMITATNNGPDDVVNAIVADTLPAGLTAISWTCTGAGGGTCTANGSGNIYDAVYLPAGATVTYTVQAEVALGIGGRLTHTATITAPIGTTDPAPGNNSASYTYTLSDDLPCGTDPTLVGCWQMDENGGTVLLDDSSYANDADLYGAPTWVTGIGGSFAIDLNGTSQYALVPDNASLDIADQITILTWIRPEQYATQDLIKKATNGAVNGYELTLATTKSDASSQRAFFRINQASNGDTYRINATSMYPIDGTWMHVAATYDGSTMRLYINGVEEAHSVVPVPSIELNNVALSMGAQSTPSRYFKGWMDDARVYHRALSPEEIRAIINPPPVAVDDTYGTPEDALLTVSAPGVLSNDTDANLDPLTAIKITDPAHGILTLNPDGSFTYEPEANWNGSDSFTYKANDTQADSNTATVTVTVSEVNDAPELGPIGPMDTDEMVPLVFTATATDIDLPANTLTYSLADGSSGSIPEGADIDPSSGDFSWTPTEAQGPYTYTFDVCVSDGSLVDCETISVTVSEVATAPRVVPDIYDILVNSILLVAEPGVLANDSDADLPADTLTAILDTATTHGLLVLYPDGSFTYTPEAMWSGIDTFTYRVYDGTSYSEVVSVTITVNLLKVYLLIISKEL